jgi:PAS domain S-box-containing protein
MTNSSKFLNLSSLPRLPRSLSALETWGFGLSGLLLWLGTAPAMHVDLKTQAIWVWLPGAIVGVLLNLQVRHLGTRWQDMSGGTPNYTTRLLKNQSSLATYVAIGYWLGWVSVPAINAIILSDLIKANLEPLGIAFPELLFKIGFTALPFIVAFSGTRALGILHLFFIMPAIGLLLTFCLQGLGWLALSPQSPGFFPPQSVIPQPFVTLSFSEWAKWFFVAVYAVYGCETASSFVADSRKPTATLKSLSFAALLLPIVYVGGSWVIARLANTSDTNAFTEMVIAATPFWGGLAPVLITFLIASGCLLSSATAASNAPRVLYQLALDGYLAPVFGVVSRRGVLGPSLAVTGLLSLICLAWGDVARVVMITGTGYLASMIGIHWGMWVRRHRPEALWARWSLGFCLVEIAVLIVGGLAWGWQDWGIGLMLPIAVLFVNAAIARSRVTVFQAGWWLHRYQASPVKISDLMFVQVCVLIFLVCGATMIGWATRALLDGFALNNHANLFVVLLLAIAFVGVAIACWTSLPQVAAVVEAREAAEHLFNVVQDAIVVVDESGIIQRTNPAVKTVFGQEKSLKGQRLSHHLLELSDQPQEWQKRSEQPCQQGDTLKILDVSVSAHLIHDFREYVVILQDITERKQSDIQMRESQQKLSLLVQQSPVGVIERNLAFEVTAWNPAATKIFGYEAAEIIGRSTCGFIVPESLQERVRQMLQTLVSQKHTVYNTNSNLTKDGRTIICEWHNTPLVDPSGQVIGIASLVMEVTEREQAEAQLRQQKQELEQTLQTLRSTQAKLVQSEKMSSLGQLVAGVAHEINNPVNFIYGNLSHANEYSQDLLSLLQLYQQNYPNPSKDIHTLTNEIDLDFLREDLPKLLHSMKVGADRIRQIVISLRNFSRMDEADMKTVDIHEGIDSTLMILQNRIKARGDHPGIQVINDYGDLPLIECYAGQLNQVFMNILSNGIDALDDAIAKAYQAPNQNSDFVPTIRITTEMDSAGLIAIRIVNNGPAIPEITQQRLFEPFFTTKPVGKGTGLGLSISYDIITDKHGGQLYCQSSLETGTEFIIEIPKRQAAYNVL